jgi:hypothetical protein
MKNLIIIYWIIFGLIAAFTQIATKSVLRKAGFPVSFLNNDLKEMRNLLSLIRKETTPKRKRIFQALYGLHIITIIGFIGWIILILFVIINVFQN